MRAAYASAENFSTVVPVACDKRLSEPMVAMLVSTSATVAAASPVARASPAVPIFSSERLMSFALFADNWLILSID